MRLTTKGRFAVTAMIDLALRCADGPVTLAGIADRQKISLSYLEQLFGKLRRFELVSSVRGPGGGYALARDMAAITVADSRGSTEIARGRIGLTGQVERHDGVVDFTSGAGVVH